MLKKKVKKQILIGVAAIALVASIYLYNKYTTKAELDEVLAYYVAVDIPPRTEITEDMILERSTPSRSIPPNAIKNKKEIIGKFTSQGYGLSPNSHFFEDVLVEKEQLPDAALLKLNEGEAALPLIVDLESSLANSIIPESKVDMYFSSSKQTEEGSKVINGTFLENVRVLSVKDSAADNVFDDEATSKKEKTLTKIYIFAVPEEYVDLVEKSKKIGEVSPVATSRTYNKDAVVELGNEEVVKYIQNATLKVEENEQ